MQKGVKIQKQLPDKYSKLSKAEAVETAKQRLTALATRLKRYTREVETKIINRMFSLYSQWQVSKMAAGPPKAEMEQYWNDTWDKEMIHNTNAQWLVDLQAEHSSLPDQAPVVVTMANIQKSVKNEELGST